MAKLERVLKCDMYSLLHDIDAGIRESISASLEEETVEQIGSATVVMRVYERYSYFGGNRVSLTVLAIKDGEKVRLSAVSSGGSQGIFLKFNTIGEKSFLSKLSQIVDTYQQAN